MGMSNKEKKVQIALGLEKGFITQISIEVPVYVSVPIIAKGLSVEEVRERLFNLPDDVKKRIIKHTGKVLVNTEHICTPQDLGEEAIDAIIELSKVALKNIDPKQLVDDTIDIDTDADVDTVDDAIEYLKEEMSLEDDEILII
ncbi:unnamed protein product [marine sediment metagenome]|uniref:Uncharacterized protein n=1 Tax=marine sediment metagenome TaxID=412755 RepID=X0VYW0_9ZZZZ